MTADDLLSLPNNGMRHELLTGERQEMASIWLDKLMNFTRAERFEIAMALWESLSEAAIEADPVLSPEQRAELCRRLAKYEADPDSPVPWEAVLARHSTVGRRSIEGRQ